MSPAWESKNDWEIYKAIAKKVSEFAKVHLPDPVKDIVMLPLQHDTPDELAQPLIVDWKTGQVDAIPGKTMPKFRIVERDYVHLYDRMVMLGRGVEKNGVFAHGLSIPVSDEYQKLQDRQPRKFDGQTYPSLETARQTAEAILALDPASNGELAHRAFEVEEHKTGLSLTGLAAGTRSTRITFDDIVAQPRRVLTSPTWSGEVNNGRAYSPMELRLPLEMSPGREAACRAVFG